MSDTEKPTDEDWTHAREAAADRMRAFLWREGVALRAPVEQELVSRQDAVRVVLEGFRRALDDEAEQLIHEALRDGGPSPQDQAVAQAEQELAQEVLAMRPKPRARKPALAPVRAMDDDAAATEDAPATDSQTRERPHLRLASPEDKDAPGSQLPPEPPNGQG